jgi:hypothetical protein
MSRRSQSRKLLLRAATARARLDELRIDGLEFEARLVCIGGEVTRGGGAEERRLCIATFRDALYPAQRAQSGQRQQFPQRFAAMAELKLGRDIDLGHGLAESG